MKEAILKILKEETSVEGRYIGGGDEPAIIVFTRGDDCDKDIFLDGIADEIVKEIEKSQKG